ncbi:TPD1 protein homolog 1-like [Mercurialis annua]|uniref:TPD1 protein homolog 1-like n=1 Tax=Mercurialis annua TaxID=3986 RepID=UPI002160954C|nr:TPD1 protein homolog 1-like [Mercurialis annua]
MIMSFFHFCYRYLIIMLIIITGSGLILGSQSGIETEFLQSYDENNNYSLTMTKKMQQYSYSAHNRKLLFHGSCSNRDISISQSRDSSSGIPQYIVQIISTCSVSRCAPSNIHLHCGWFASARMVNPTIFKRLSYDDCLVNGGKALKNSQMIRFAYSNSFMYILAFKTANFC